MEHILINPMIYPGLTESGRIIFDKKLKPCLSGTPDDIITNVCNFFKVTKDELLSEKRTRDLVMYRTVAIFNIKIHNRELSLVKIGGIFNRHHATVIYNIAQYEDLLKYDKTFQAMVSKFNSFVSAN